MTIRLALDREVTLVPILDGPRDRYGNPSRVAGDPVPGQRCRREQITVDEDIADRDQQVQRFRYTFAADPGPLALTGRDRILDGDLVVEVHGQPEHLSRRFRLHHVEALGYVVEG